MYVSQSSFHLKTWQLTHLLFQHKREGHSHFVGRQGSCLAAHLSPVNQKQIEMEKKKKRLIKSLEHPADTCTSSNLRCRLDCRFVDTTHEKIVFRHNERKGLFDSSTDSTPNVYVSVI